MSVKHIAWVISSVVAASGCAPMAVENTTARVDDKTIEWQTQGGSLGSTRYAPAKQITAENFSQLKPAWVWDGASFNAASGRSTPTYIDGMLYTVAGPRRHVVAIDPEFGAIETVYGMGYRWLTD